VVECELKEDNCPQGCGLKITRDKVCVRYTATYLMSDWASCGQFHTYSYIVIKANIYIKNDICL
jgi:hypothetical protein